ncbi:hypothetical protein GGR53DRAFT_468836 [Hypoxylon sp. FL1150]|nr:hypothetical protein GGR53DRAFT_468836 [Hypoxylon sp. FL1150]
MSNVEALLGTANSAAKLLKELLSLFGSMAEEHSPVRSWIIPIAPVAPPTEANPLKRKGTSTSQSEPLSKRVQGEKDDDYRDLFDLLQKSISPAPKPVTNITNLEYSPAMEQEMLLKMETSFGKLSGRVRRMHSILFSLLGWTTDPEMRFVQNHDGWTIKFVNPDRQHLSEYLCNPGLSVDESDEVEMILCSFYDAKDLRCLLGDKTLDDLKWRNFTSADQLLESFSAIMKIVVPITQYTILALVLKHLLMRTKGPVTWTEAEKNECSTLLVRINFLCFLQDEFVKDDGKQRHEIIYWGWMAIQGVTRRRLIQMVKELVHPEAEKFLFDAPSKGPMHGSWNPSAT